MAETINAGVGEFPFVESLPKVVVNEVKGAKAMLQRVVKEYEAAVAEHGVLVPPTTVAEVLGVSPQRVGNLMDEKRLDGIEVSGRRWVTAASIRRYLDEGPRPAGRPKKVGKWKNTWNCGREWAAAVEGQLEK